MKPNYIFRPAGDCRDCIDIKRRGIAGQDCPLLANLIQYPEDLLLGLKVFVDSFDHKICICQIGVLE
ncbi:hypothetical protein D3C76_1634900 [compost metagenome]